MRRWDCPPTRAARLAVRTQQVLAEETDVPDIVDPFGGSSQSSGSPTRSRSR